MVIINNECLDYDDFLDYNQYEKKCEDNKEYNYTLQVIKENTYRCESIDINMCKGIKEKYIPIELENLKYIRIQGMLKNECGEPIKDKKVVIYRSQLINFKTEYIKVCEAMTDEFGVYHAIVDKMYSENNYILKVE